MTTSTEIPIAGVLWPTYKLVALAIGVLIMVVAGVFAASVGTAVVAGFAAATVVWLALRALLSAER